MKVSTSWFAMLPAFIFFALALLYFVVSAAGMVVDTLWRVARRR